MHVNLQRDFWPTSLPLATTRRCSILLKQDCFPELFLEHSNFLLAVFENALLISIHPPSPAGHMSKQKLFLPASFIHSGSIVIFAANVQTSPSGSEVRLGQHRFVGVFGHYTLLACHFSRRPGLGIDRTQIASGEGRVLRRELGGTEDRVGVLAHRLRLSSVRSADFS